MCHLHPDLVMPACVQLNLHKRTHLVVPHQLPVEGCLLGALGTTWHDRRQIRPAVLSQHVRECALLRIQTPCHERSIFLGESPLLQADAKRARCGGILCKDQKSLNRLVQPVHHADIGILALSPAVIL